LAGFELTLFGRFWVTPEGFGERAYHLGMSRIDSNPADRMEAANALVRGVPEEEDEEEEEEEEQGEDDEEGEIDEDEGEGYSE
jgi:hypothetical protein